MFLELIHGLFITYKEFRLSTTFIPIIIIMHIYNWYHSLLQSFRYIHRVDRLCTRLSLAPLAPLVPSPLTWNPPCCDRIRPPLPWVARKLTPVFPSPAHLAPYPKSRTLGVSQTRNRHWLGRHCEPIPYARLQSLYTAHRVQHCAIDQQVCKDRIETRKEFKY